MAITGSAALPFKVTPMNNIQPFTYRDGMSHMAMLEKLRVYINDNLRGEFNEGLDHLLLEVEAGIANAEAVVLEAKDGWQALFDLYMVDVNASLMALNDAAMGALIATPGSDTADALANEFSKRAVSTVGFVGTSTTRLQSAVDRAILDGVPLHVPEDLTVTGNITAFWDAYPSGTGSITRDGSTFHLSPRPTSGAVPVNNLYVNAATGSDTNDGLSSSFPLKTLSKLYTGILRRLTPEQAAGAKWVINLAGTFTKGQTFTDLPEFPHVLEFVGAPLVLGAHQTFIEMGAGSSKIGLWFEPGRATVTVRNILFRGFRDNGSGYGILMKGGGSINAYYCRAEDCDTGFAAIRNVDFLFDHCTTSPTVDSGFIAQYSASGTFQYCDADGSTDNGFTITRNAVAHVDYSLAMNCNVGVAVDMASRVNCLSTEFRKNGVGVVASGASEWIDASCNFNIGNANANTSNYKNYGVGRESRLYSQTSRNEFKIGDSWTANPTYENSVIHSGTTANTLIYVGSALGELPEGFFIDRGKRLRVEVYGTGTFTADAKVKLYANDGASTLLVSEATIGSGAGPNFKLEFVVRAIHAASQETVYSLTALNGSRTGAKVMRTLNMNVEQTLRLYAELGNAADSITFHTMETFLMG